MLDTQRTATAKRLAATRKGDLVHITSIYVQGTGSFFHPIDAWAVVTDDPTDGQESASIEVFYGPEDVWKEFVLDTGDTFRVYRKPPGRAQAAYMRWQLTGQKINAD